MINQRIAFALVDVFTDEPLSGNPLAVIPNADALDERTMRQIARELGQAETTFLLVPRHPEAAWRLRCFTAPGSEIFGVGHNSLGAWWWLAEAGLLGDTDGAHTFKQEIGDRLLPVVVERHCGATVSVTLTQAPPVLGATVTDLGALAEALRLPSAALLQSPALPRVVSTGAAHLLVPLRDRASLAAAAPDSDRLAAVLHAVGAQGCYTFTRDGAPEAGVAAYARFTNPTAGIVEEAATGSAAGPLACFLVAHGLAPTDAPVVIEQGHEFGRPSRLVVQVSGDVVRLLGRGVIEAEGVMRISRPRANLSPESRPGDASGPKVVFAQDHSAGAVG